MFKEWYSTLLLNTHTTQKNENKTLLNQYQYTTTMQNKIKNFTQSNDSSREEPQVHHSVKKRNISK